MNVGDVVPELTFRHPDGSPAPLGSFLASDFLLVLFLRHLT
jgi:hypothetical protein